MKKCSVFFLLVFMVAGASEGQAQSGSGSVTTNNTTIEAPVQPMKADNKSPVMEIVIAPGSFKEFSLYKGIKFQIDERKTPLNPRDSSEEWNNLELVKGNGKGNYLAKFSNAKRTATYAVKPVFEGQDYENALKTFEKANAAYKQRVAERARSAEANRALYVKDFMEYNRRETARMLKENDMALRIYYVDGYGFMNSKTAEAFKFHYINATFKTKDGEPFEPGGLALYVRGVHGCVSTNADHLAVKLGADNMLLTTYNGRFAYVSFNEFKKLHITGDTKTQTFIMKVVAEKDNNYEYLKRVAMQ